MASLTFLLFFPAALLPVFCGSLQLSRCLFSLGFSWRCILAFIYTLFPIISRKFHYHSAAGFLHIGFSVLADCLSLHAALLFLLSLRFVSSCFDASSDFIYSSFAFVEFFSSVFLFLWQFSFPILPGGAATSFACSCVLFAFIFLLSRLSVFFFFFMNGNTERAKCALSRVCIP